MVVLFQSINLHNFPLFPSLKGCPLGIKLHLDSLFNIARYFSKLDDQCNNVTIKVNIFHVLNILAPTNVFSCFLLFTKMWFVFNLIKSYCSRKHHLIGRKLHIIYVEVRTRIRIIHLFL